VNWFGESLGRCLCVSCLLFSSIISGGYRAADAEDQSELLDQIRVSLRSYASNIDSLSYSYQISGAAGFKSSVVVLMQGPSFRIEREDQTPYRGGEIQRYECAFDGHDYGVLDHATGILSVASPEHTVRKIAGVPLPHLEMFDWLFDSRRDGQEVSWQLLQTAELFDSRFQDCSFVAIDASDNPTFRFPQKRVKQGVWYYEVTFAHTHNYFPMRVARKRVIGDQEVRVTAAEISGIADQRNATGRVGTSTIPWPHTIRLKRDGRPDQRLETDPSSLRINEEIDESRFVIDAGSADRVNSVDEISEELERRRKAEPRPEAQPATRSTPLSFWLLIANILFIFVVVVSLWKLKKAKKNG